MKVISPSSQDVCEFGNTFIDDYISLLEKSVNDNYNWVSWFVFENDFGKKKLKAILPGGRKVKIASEKQLYDFCIKGQD